MWGARRFVPAAVVFGTILFCITYQSPGVQAASPMTEHPEWWWEEKEQQIAQVPLLALLSGPSQLLRRVAYHPKKAQEAPTKKEKKAEKWAGKVDKSHEKVYSVARPAVDSWLKKIQADTARLEARNKLAMDAFPFGVPTKQ
eukprot:GHVT01062142.1.p1 GENE.GHVT01062142.1~~GHVT01062142.1.p1  ORF type:complete len:142 (+),score=31.93 GHVT01062142.1:150-575(+)